MPFTIFEKIAKADKLSQQISGSANLSPGEKFWYNEQIPYSQVLPLNKLWNSYFLIPGSATPADADIAVSLNPSCFQN